MTHPQAGLRCRVITGTLQRVRPEKKTFNPEVPAPRRPARVARMLALAHRIQDSLDAGRERDRAAVARKLRVTRARITQLLDILLLAPDLQELVLHMEAVDGAEPTTERALRIVARESRWARQRAAWAWMVEEE